MKERISNVLGISLILALMLIAGIFVMQDAVFADETDSVSSDDLNLTVQIASEDDEVSDGWVTDDETGDKYYYKDGTAVTGFYTIDDLLYYFDETGVLFCKGLFEADGSSYYASAEGVIQTGVFTADDGSMYIAGSSGALQKGFVTSDGALYYADDSYLVRTGGWFTVSGKKYYAKSDGKLYKDGFATIDGSKYYFTSAGVLTTGVFKYSNTYYLADLSGKIATSIGLKSYDGNKYYVKSSSGALLTSAMKWAGGYKYYFGSNAKAVKGAFSYNGARYIANAYAHVKTTKGWITYNGKKYYAKKGGKLYTSVMKKIGKYKYGFAKDGHAYVGAFYYKGHYYFAYKSSKVKTSKGWASYGGKKYYAKKGGVLYRNTIKKIGKYYYCFAKKGAYAMTGVFKYKGNYRYAYSSGKIKRSAGWVKYKGKTYRAKKGGILYKNKLVKIGKKYYYFNKQAVACSKVKGIDVSQWQGSSINWTKVKKAGIKFVFIRVGYSGYSTGKIVADTYYRQNITGAKKAGIEVGIYFYSQAITTKEAKKEAKFCVSIAKKYSIKLPIVIDTEYCSDSRARANKLSVSQRTKVVKAFCSYVKSKGYNAMIYSNRCWLQTHLKMSDLSAYDIWCAEYGVSKCKYSGTIRAWQYTSSGKVSGISGRVDLDYYYLEI